MKRIYLYLLLTIVISICVWTLMQRKLPLKTMSTTQTNSSVATGVVSTAPLSNQIPVDLSKQWVRPPGVSDGGWAYAIRWRETLLHWNHPLDFFARVVDQNDQPVDDAKMEFRIVRVDEKTVLSQAFLHMKEGSEQDFQTKTLLSDEKGWISLTGISGKSLTAINLSKIGCISSYPSTYYVGMSYDPNGQRNPSGDIFVTNAWNPKVGYTFHLWKKGATEKLIQWDSGYRITRDKPEQIVSIFPASEGQALYADLVLKTPFAHPEITDGDRAYDRWIIIEAAQDAGIQETSMLYPYLAPQENYGREFRFMYQLGSRESDGWTKRFYVKARNGKVFASLTVDFSSQSGLTLGIKTIVNPTGSRNLEPDPAKLITDPAEIRRLDEATRVK